MIDYLDIEFNVILMAVIAYVVKLVLVSAQVCFQAPDRGV